MTEYAFVTIWRLAAPIEAVWEEVSHPERWPAWWPYVRRVTRVTPGDADGVGALWRHEWGTRLPYTLSFELRTTRVEAPRLLAASAVGELDGTGEWQLAAVDGSTVARYDWNVRTTKRWMNVLAPVARPFFRWNHAVVMNAGGKALARRLGTRLLASENRAS